MPEHEIVDESNVDTPIKPQTAEVKTEDESTVESAEESNEETTEETEDKPSEKLIDHKAEAEKLRKQLEKAEYAAKKYNEDRRSVEEEKKRLEDELEGSSSLSKDEIDRIVDSKLQNYLAESNQTTARSLVKGLVGDDEDALDHVMLVYQTKVRQTGDLEQDVQSAYAIANAKKILQENTLLRQKNLAKSSNGGGGGQKKKSSQKGLTEAQKAQITKWGKNPNDYYISSDGEMKKREQKS